MIKLNVRNVEIYTSRTSYDFIEINYVRWEFLVSFRSYKFTWLGKSQFMSYIFQCHVRAIWYPSWWVHKNVSIYPLYNIVSHTASYIPTHRLVIFIPKSVRCVLYLLYVYSELNLHIINIKYDFQRKYFCRTQLAKSCLRESSLPFYCWYDDVDVMLSLLVGKVYGLLWVHFPSD